MKHDKNLIVLGVSRSGQHFILNQLESWSIPYNIYKFENAIDRIDEKIKSYKVDMSLDTEYAVILRDYPNWLASIVKFVSERENPENKDERIQYYVDQWKSHCRKVQKEETPLFQRFYYKQFKTPSLREWYYCNKLGGDYNDDAILTIPKAGGGSSFNGLEFEGYGDLMNTLYRYRDMVDSNYRDEYLKYYLKDKEALELNLKLF